MDKKNGNGKRAMKDLELGKTQEVKGGGGAQRDRVAKEAVLHQQQALFE